MKTVSPENDVEYIWNFGIIARADKGFHGDFHRYFANEPVFDPGLYQDIKKGDVVWVRCEFLSVFCEKILPEVKEPFVLLIMDGDEHFPHDCPTDTVLTILNSSKIHSIFAQNMSAFVIKTRPIPIGIDYHTVAYRGGGWGDPSITPVEQEKLLDSLSIPSSVYWELGTNMAFIDFQHADTLRASFKRYQEYGEDRASIFQILKDVEGIDHGFWMKRSELWKKKSGYRFSICPPGNGLDTHRTWEDMALGKIVIVKTSTIDILFKNHPVVIVKDWKEITTESLFQWHRERSMRIHDESSLFMEHWVSEIEKEVKVCQNI